ncbi:MAG: MBL fold metallo-hydrolase [Patescibacteria group bacterium]
MEIIWHGNSCLTFKGKGGVTLITNPQTVSGKMKGEIVLVSGPNDKAIEVEGSKNVVDWPGEYEMSDIPIFGLQVDKTVIYCFEIEGIKICHLGELANTLTSETVKDIGDVDVLVIKVGAGSNLDGKKAMEVIEEIEPRVVIPMTEDNDAEMAIKSIGANQVETAEKFVIKSRSELPEDQMRYVALTLTK